MWSCKQDSSLLSLVEFVGTGGTTDEFEYMLVSTVGSVATDGFYEV